MLQQRVAARVQCSARGREQAGRQQGPAMVGTPQPPEVREAGHPTLGVWELPEGQGTLSETGAARYPPRGARPTGGAPHR